MSSVPSDCLGVLGGMGPLASAHLLREIYACWAGPEEQTLPRVILFSDPSVPDRIEALRADRHAEMAAVLADRLRTLVRAGCRRTLVCCFTMHAFLRDLPADVAASVISLVDVAADAMDRGRPRRTLVLCAAGARAARTFAGLEGRHPLAYLGDEPQERLDREIRSLKLGRESSGFPEWVGEMAREEEADAVLLGCTELPMAIREIPAPVAVIDPMAHFVRNWAGYVRTP